MNTPSIFNDVIGPVMRGPSSSHCAAALRIGRICRDLMDEEIRTVLIEFDLNGSLATTHKGQGSDMGLFGGFLGWEAHDERLPNYEEAIAESGMDIHIKKHEFGAEHPNTYKMTFTNEVEDHTITAISIGGGMIEVIEIDGSPLSMCGDYFETLIYASDMDEVSSFIESSIPYEECVSHKGSRSFIQLKTSSPLENTIVEELGHINCVSSIKQIAPVLPVLSRKSLEVPFLTCDEMMSFNKNKKLTLWELALKYESVRGNMPEEEVLNKMAKLVNILKESIEGGLKGTEYEDRILGSQSLTFKEKMDKERLPGGDLLNHIILYVSAMMEVKSSMGVIIAAPTAGACGALPGAVLGAAKVLGLDDLETTKAMLSAGLIGVFIAANATFAAEVGGCQAECGSGSCMAAAALVQMSGGSLDQSISAASQALQNSLGMICDPIANRVEAPCLGKNVMAASNALSCANMALSNYDHLIPLDQVIDAMARVSEQMAHELRCTALGGLSTTKASQEILAQLEGGSLGEGQEMLAESAAKFKIC